MLQDIDVSLTVELGSTKMRLKEVCELVEEQVIMLDRLVDEPLDLLVNGTIVARGEVVAEGNRFGIKIIEMVGGEIDAAPPATPEPAQ